MSATEFTDPYRTIACSSNSGHMQSTRVLTDEGLLHHIQCVTTSSHGTHGGDYGHEMHNAYRAALRAGRLVDWSVTICISGRPRPCFEVEFIKCIRTECALMRGIMGF